MDLVSQRIPLRISLVYALVGGGWILFSDFLVSVLFTDPAVITRVEVFKGWFFILVTSGMLYFLILHSVSSLKKSEEALRESEEKFHMLVETTASGIFIYRERILFVNSAMERLTGYTREELIGMNLRDIVHKDYIEHIERYCEALRTGEGGSGRCEVRINSKGGEERWADFASSVIRYEGARSGLGTAFDITKRKRTEEALRASEERLRLLVERVTDYEIFMLDPEGRVVLWNLGAERSKGYSPEEVIGKMHSIFFTPEDIERGLPEMELRTAGDRGRFEDEGWRVRKDGSLFWANVVTTALRDDRGVLRGFSKVIRDITERKKAADTLSESEERYRVIAETASDAIVTIDEQSTIVFANPAVEKIFGYSVGEIVGRSLTLLMPERFRQGHLRAVKRYLSTGNSSMKWELLELPGLHKGGHELPLEISYGVFRKEGKSFFSGIIRDITERKEAEKEKEYKDMLERFNLELETLVAERTLSLMALKLADKVRTPAAVIGLTGKKILGMPETSDAPRVREELTIIVDAADKLHILVREFQSLLKGKKPVFNYEEINEIVKGAVSIIEKEAEAKHVEIILNLSGSPLRINAQKDLLRMAVFTMLRNAVESTTEGGRITVETGGGDDRVRLTVSDTGYGIPKEILKNIFDPFYSARLYRFGMGLPLIKQIVTEHLGDIQIESETGKGTTLRVTFPVRWKEEAAAAS